MHDKDELPPSLTPLLMMRRMVVIEVDQGLLLVNLSHMKRNTIVNTDTRAQLTEDWEMTLWAKRWTKFPSRPSRAGLKEQLFPGISISQRSPSTMDERTQWTMWAISVREWLSILRMKPWCARCSIQSGTHCDEMIRRPKGKFHRFLQGAHPGISLSFYYVY